MTTSVRAANLIISFLQEENVTVEDFNKELNLNGFIHALCGNAHGFLQTISCVLAVLQLTHSDTRMHTLGYYFSHYIHC